MKKIICLVIISVFLAVACSKSPEVYKGNSHKKEKIYKKKGSHSVKREKIDLEYSAFDKFNLPLPENNYGHKVDYLIPVRENFNEDFSLFKKYNENKALKFYKNLDITGYGDNSYYWRWKTTIKKSDWYNQVRKKVYTISKSNYRNIFILEGNKWVHRRISKLGRIKNIRIIARGPSGIVTHILIETSNHKYLVTKEWNVRKIFATHHNLYGAKAKQNYNMKRPIMRNVASLPSANLAFEEHGSYVTIYGGGFGHGAGMCQYAAPDLVKAGYDYDEILKRYYNSAKLTTVKKVLGENKNILVGITSYGSNINHRKLTIFSKDRLRIFNEDFDISMGKNEKVRVENKWGKVCITIPNGKKFHSRHTVNFKSYGEFVVIGPIRKAHTSYPKYRDTIMISPLGSKNLKVINSIDIEKYLMQVIPSEMPISFGLEALKVQAVAARTYALREVLNARYKNLGFHIKDTIESQVYNNQVESPIANKAIRETKNEIMAYNNKPIDAKYFSTSSGFTSFANDIW